MIETNDDIIAKVMLADESLCSECLFSSTLPSSCNIALVESEYNKTGDFYYNKTHLNSMKYKYSYDCKGFRPVD